MSTNTPVLKPHRAPLARFDRVMERILGTDMRLLYGMGVPVIVMSVVIAVLLGFAASPWIVAGLMVLLVACLGVVLLGFVGMLSEDEDDDDAESA